MTSKYNEVKPFLNKNEFPQPFTEEKEYKMPKKKQGVV